MIEASVEDTPLTIVWKKLADEDAVLDVMREVVPTDPPMFEERVLVATERVLEVERLVMVALVVVEFPMMTSVRLVRVATKLEKNPLVDVAFVLVRFPIVEEEKIGVSVKL